METTRETLRMKVETQKMTATMISTTTLRKDQRVGALGPFSSNEERGPTMKVCNLIYYELAD